MRAISDATLIREAMRIKEKRLTTFGQAMIEVFTRHHLYGPNRICRLCLQVEGARLEPQLQFNFNVRELDDGHSRCC